MAVRGICENTEAGKYGGRYRWERAVRGIRGNLEPGKYGRRYTRETLLLTGLVAAGATREPRGSFLSFWSRGVIRYNTLLMLYLFL